MTDHGQTSLANTSLRVDGIPLPDLAKYLWDLGVGSSGATAPSKMWVSGRKTYGSRITETMVVSFGGERLVNHISFAVGRFPHFLMVDYLDHTGTWQRLTHAKTANTSRGRVIARRPVEMVTTTSLPGKVNSASATSHPQHFGKSHWSRQSWAVTPVLTRKIRFRLKRWPSPNVNDPRLAGGITARYYDMKPPVDHRGRKVPYSLAMKDVQVGYRVITQDDIPITPPLPPGAPEQAEDWWASSRDILGSRTVYSTYKQPASSAIDGNAKTYWLSEPQPFPFAVVNLFLDIRDHEGVAPVVDRGGWIR